MVNFSQLNYIILKHAFIIKVPPDAKNEEENLQETKCKKIKLALAFAFVIPQLMPPPDFFEEQSSISSQKKKREANVHRDRNWAIEYARSWDDHMFYRQFRLCRADFNILMEKVRKSYQIRNAIILLLHIPCPYFLYIFFIIFV